MGGTVSQPVLMGHGVDVKTRQRPPDVAGPSGAAAGGAEPGLIGRAGCLHRPTVDAYLH